MNAASIIAPTAPTAADSVAVATPPKIEPSTKPIRASGGNITVNIRFLIPLANRASLASGFIYGTAEGLIMP